MTDLHSGTLKGILKDLLRSTLNGRAFLFFLGIQNAKFFIHHGSVNPRRSRATLKSSLLTSVCSIRETYRSTTCRALNIHLFRL